MERDPILSKVKGMILSGWPADTTGMEEELRPFARRKYELSVEEGCVRACYGVTEWWYLAREEAKFCKCCMKLTLE